MVSVANYFECDRLSAIAGEAIGMGNLIKMVNNGGQRDAMLLLNADAADMIDGFFGVAYKVSADAQQVVATTANTTITGNRVVTIVSGDQMVELRKGTQIEYEADDLDNSLNPGQGGTTPNAGDALEILGSKWCAVGEIGAITTIAGRVYKTEGTNVVVEFLGV